MAVKVFFVGNPFGTDDGIGPYLYNVLKDDSRLKEFELMEMGVIGFDMINYISDGDSVIIVDAARIKDGKGNIGDVTILSENELKPEVSLVSEHDFGVEETARVMRIHAPNLKTLKVVGIKVEDTNAFSQNLSAAMNKRIEHVKNEIVKDILRIAGSADE